MKPQYRFPSSVRLRKRTEYLRLSTVLTKIGKRGFLVVWQENNASTARLGITASKKVGCAVVRNRIKRYVREIFRLNIATLPCIDVLIIARKESASMGFLSVRRELEAAMQYIGTKSCSNDLHSY